MEHLGTAYSVAQSLYEAVQSPALQEMCSVWGYESELESLQGTVDTIKAVIRDAECKQDRGELLTHQVQLWVEQLKDALYDADDLLDKFVTLAEQKQQLRDNDTEGISLSLFKKVRQFCSSENPLLVARNMSRDVREVRNKLDSIAENHNKFGFKFDSQPIRRRREETCSFVYAQDIIGRKDDVEKIVGRLVDPDLQQEDDVSSLAIVGIGGLGKTTLAQQVFKDDRVKHKFSLRLWVSVGDLDKSNIDVKAILCKILHSFTPQNHEHLSLEHLQTQVREQLAGKKFFLVLDDLWNEVHNQWLELEKFLRVGLKGSWILVTTRSEKSAEAVGDKDLYRLKGLSKEDSWSLFEMAAFGQGAGQADPNLVEIGKKIVGNCGGVPLAIRVVGSLLYGQGKDKWLSLSKSGLGTKQGIEPILKFSYHTLESPLKPCFAYCSLFPKGCFIWKEELIMLWIAQGFVIPLDEGQSVQDAAEEYFSILLKRCFFQDVGTDWKGEIVVCKLHDLMHDLAEEVAGGEIVRGCFIPITLNNKVRHRSIYRCNEDQQSQLALTGAKLRTCLLAATQKTFPLDTALANWKCLRTLCLRGREMTQLPSALGGLLHLRYLNISDNDMEVLPSSIANLHNLEVLLLRFCEKLQELPKDLGKLTKLKVLDISGCESLWHVPGIGRLRCLWKLPFIVLGKGTSNQERGQLAHQVQEIKALQNLKGSLWIHIEISADATYVRGNRSNGDCLSPHLTEVVIIFSCKGDISEMGTSFHEVEQGVLEDLLQPHHYLKELTLDGYWGGRMPNWATKDDLAIFFPNLDYVLLWSCHKLQQIGMLGTLPKLRSLNIQMMDDLEYIENRRRGKGALESHPSFFPSLETLVLRELPKLKGWWREESSSNQIDDDGLILPSFPRLSRLVIFECPNLASMPLCPTVEDLNLQGCNVDLRIMESVKSVNSKLRILVIDNVAPLKLGMPVEAFQCLSSLSIRRGKLSEVEEVFRSCSSSLRQLSIVACSELKSVSGVLELLTALETLTFSKLPDFSVNKQGEEDTLDGGIPWHSLQHTLLSLVLSGLPKLVKLPNGMHHLTNLQSLEIWDCKNLEEMPEWMPELTSLNRLRIERCSDSLYRRCCKDIGEDWPSIHHIPCLTIINPVPSNSSDQNSEAESDGGSEAESDGDSEAESDT